jgi:hypothetical protein
MIESTLLSLVEKYLTVENSITYDPLTLKTTMYFRNKVAYEHSLDLTELENHLIEKVKLEVKKT